MSKKIVITTPTLSVGGMERAVINVSRQLNLMGYSVVIFVLFSNDVFYDIPPGVGLVFGKKNIKNKFLAVFSLIKLRSFCSSFKPDYIFSFSGMHSSYVIMATWGLNLNVFAFHRASPYKVYSKINDKLNRYYFPRCAGLIVQTLETKEIFKKKYNPHKIIVFPNPIREFKIEKTINTEKIVLSIGRLVPSKRFDDLIRIFDTVYLEGWKLVIVGGGCLYDDFIKMVNHKSLEGKVELVGFKDDVDKYLQMASVFAFTSESEGYPNALLEAMCFGLPCISYNCPTGPSDMIIDGVNGYLVELKNEQEFARKLKTLMEDNELRTRFSIEAKKLQEKHNPKKLLENLMKEITME